MKHPHWVVSILGACIAMQVGVASAAEYSVTQISVPNATEVYGAAINDQGVVVGSYGTANNTYQTPFAYRDGQVSDLTAGLPQVDSFRNFRPVGLSNNGLVLLIQDGNNAGQGMLLDLNSGARTMFFNGYVRAISNAGVVAADFNDKRSYILTSTFNVADGAGTYQRGPSLTASADSAGFLYQAGQFSEIPSLSPKPDSSGLLAVNDQKQVVGKATTQIDQFSYWVDSYVSDGKSTFSLNPLNDGLNSWRRFVDVTGIQESGVVYGTARGIKSDSSMPFEYQNGEFKALGLPSGAVSTTIVAGNDRGQYVGWSYDGTGLSYDLYDHGVWQDIVLPTVDGKIDFLDINNEGQLLGVFVPSDRFVGTSLLVLTPVLGAVPEPASVLLWALGLLALVRQCQRVNQRVRH